MLKELIPVKKADEIILHGRIYLPRVLLIKNGVGFEKQIGQFNLPSVSGFLCIRFCVLLLLSLGQSYILKERIILDRLASHSGSISLVPCAIREQAHQ